MTPEEAFQRNVDAMGQNIGSIYSQLWQELAWLYRTWAEYVTLFGTKESRVMLLNSAAPAFTRIVQDSLWDGIILHIARLTDPARSMGKHNLSIRALDEVVTDNTLKAKASPAMEKALNAADFCRDWRNRHLAHRDLHLALRTGGEPLKPASRLKVKEALSALSDVLNVFSRHYLGSTTLFDLDVRSGGGPDGAMSLLYYIDIGMEAERIRREHLESGEFNQTDYRPMDL